MQAPSHKAWLTAACLACLLTATAGYAEPAPADQADIFKAAGFTQSPGGQYILCAEEIPTASYVPGHIQFADLNGDGMPEAWVTESSLYCYGNTGQYFVLLTEDSGTWHKLLDGTGIPRALETRHHGWPDIEVGGPGFSKFPVYGWNGKSYNLRE